MRFSQKSDRYTIIKSLQRSTRKLSLISSYLRKWEPSKALIIVKSSTPDIFSAGTDQKALVRGGLDAAFDYYRAQYRLAHLIGSYARPYVSIWNGLTQGSGLGLSVHGHYRVATERTVFAMPEVRLGSAPDAGASYFLSRLEGRLGMYLALTGTEVRGIDVQKCGIATHYCPEEQLPHLERRLISSCNPADVARVMACYCPKSGTPHALSRYMDQINIYFDAETVDAMVAFLRRDETDWSRRTLLEFKLAAPTSLKVAHRQINAGKSLNLIDCMRMDYRVACRQMDAGDFTEGVRALIIDRDFAPKWRVQKLEDVHEERIKRFFEPFAKVKEELQPIR